MSDDKKKDLPQTIEELEREIVFGDKDAGPFDPEALKAVISALGNSAEAMRLEREEAAAPEVDYTEEMGIDAKEIAAQLAQEFGKAVQLHMHKPDGSVETVTAGDVLPKPTLGSLREQAAHVAKTFESCITELMAERVSRRENSAMGAVFSYLRTGKPDALRAAAKSRPDGHAWAQLTDDELVNLAAVNLQDNVTAALGLGIYVGQLLVRSSFTQDEALECAKDPVFIMQVQGLRVSAQTVTRLAIDVLSDVEQTRARGTRRGDN